MVGRQWEPRTAVEATDVESGQPSSCEIKLQRKMASRAGEVGPADCFQKAHLSQAFMTVYVRPRE